MCGTVRSALLRPAEFFYYTLWPPPPPHSPRFIINEDSSPLVLKGKTSLPPITHTAISRKVVGKSARDNAERYCGWVWGYCSSKKFARMAREAMDLCLQVLTASNNSRFDTRAIIGSIMALGSTATVSGTWYWSYPTSPFGIVVCTFFPTTFLEIAVCHWSLPFRCKSNTAHLAIQTILLSSA